MANIVQSDKENGAACFIRSSGDCNRTGGADILLPNVQYMKRGIFTIAYEPSKWPPVPSITGSRDALLVFGRLVKDYWTVAPQTCVAYAACLLWLTLAPGLGLSFASVVLLNLQDLMLCDEFHAQTLLLKVKWNVSLWLICGVVSYFAGERMKEFKTEFSGPIRAHFLPKLVEARLRTNSDDLTDDDYGAFPHEHEYGTYLPGYEYLHTVLQRAQHVGTVLFGVIAMACITYQFPGRFDAGFLYLLTALCVVIGLAIPLNGAGGGGYTFWTKDIEYKRLMGLFHIVFSDENRDAIHKDGLTEYVLNEYKYSSERLRTARTDYGLILCGVPIQWYWSLPDFLMNSCTMAVYGIVTPWSKPSAQSMIATMLMLPLVVTTLKDSIGKIKDCDTPLSNSMKSVQRFYRILDRTRTQKAPLAYPVSKRCHGAALSLDNVSFKYDNHWSEQTFSIENINLKIAPGQLVVITGTNGSGKSTLLKLLCGLIQPTSGSVTFDGHKLPPHEVNQHLQSVIYVGQSETIYPACSIRDHVMFGLTSRESRASVREVDVDSAVFLGEATQLVRQHGYDTILNPRSIECFVAGRKAGPSAIAALDLSAPRNLALPLSHGEKQRLAAARAFMRLNHENVRLIVLDEATNALDSIAESNILQRFREIARQKGQTMIVVTHKLANIAQCADLILCMKEGRILEHGTHDALMNVGGHYACLYRQSAACTLPSSA